MIKMPPPNRKPGSIHQRSMPKFRLAPTEKSEEKKGALTAINPSTAARLCEYRGSCNDDKSNDIHTRLVMMIHTCMVGEGS